MKRERQIATKKENSKYVRAFSEERQGLNKEIRDE